MFLAKRAVVLGWCLLSVLGLRAFDLQYGSLFQVSGITLQNGSPVLPLTRGKYVNVRVLDKDTFDFLKKCGAFCRQETLGGQTRVQSLRAAKTRPGMWIADVAVDDKWLLTFLVFKNDSAFSFIVPGEISVLDTNWLSRTKNLLQTHIQSGEQD